jgi:hypothetical protein
LPWLLSSASATLRGASVAALRRFEIAFLCCRFRRNDRFARPLGFVGDVASTQGAEEIIMKLGRLSALSSAALLAAGVSLAMAQSSPSPSSPSGSMNQPGAAQSTKCWDSASQTIKDKAPGQAAGGARQGGATTGAAPSGGASAGAGQGQRPAAAAGLPNC